MSIASVSGRIRAERLSRLSADELVARKEALKAKRATAYKPPVGEHVLYMRAWRKAGKPADFPSQSEWRARQ